MVTLGDLREYSEWFEVVPEMDDETQVCVLRSGAVELADSGERIVHPRGDWKWMDWLRHRGLMSQQFVGVGSAGRIPDVED